MEIGAHLSLEQFVQGSSKDLWDTGQHTNLTQKQSNITIIINKTCFMSKKSYLPIFDDIPSLTVERDSC